STQRCAKRRDLVVTGHGTDAMGDRDELIEIRAGGAAVDANTVMAAVRTDERGGEITDHPVVQHLLEVVLPEEVTGTVGRGWYAVLHMTQAEQCDIRIALHRSRRHYRALGKQRFASLGAIEEDWHRKPLDIGVVCRPERGQDRTGVVLPQRPRVTDPVQEDDAAVGDGPWCQHLADLAHHRAPRQRKDHV